MGHSSVTVSQRYVHPVPETMERAIERMELAANPPQPKRRVRRVPTVVPTAVKQERVTIN